MPAPMPAPAPDPSDAAHPLRRAIRLAMNGRGRVEPNPMVGCVITAPARAGTPAGSVVLGEGYHRQYGGPHAEPDALAAVAANRATPAGSTVYVTLEPCCHAGPGKKTPPCVPRLIEAKVARVVIGCLDPNPAVNGQGAARLRAAGIDVTVADGPVAASCRQLIAPFIARTAHRRPYVTLKWAQTADGKVAGPGGQRLAITGPEAARLVHDLRSRVDGILVGVNTVLTDDPLLTARHANHPRHPARFVLDRDLRTPVDANVVRDRTASTTLFCAHNTAGDFRHRRDALQSAGVTTTPVPTDAAGRLDLPAVLQRLPGVFCYELLVEPGPTLAASFFESNLADRLWVFRSRQETNAPTAPAAAPVPPHYVETGTLPVGDDTLTEYLNPASPDFFSPDRSADFVLAAESPMKP